MFCKLVSCYFQVKFCTYGHIHVATNIKPDLKMTAVLFCEFGHIHVNSVKKLHMMEVGGNKWTPKNVLKWEWFILQVLRTVDTKRNLEHHHLGFRACSLVSWHEIAKVNMQCIAKNLCQKVCKMNTQFMAFTNVPAGDKYGVWKTFYPEDWVVLFGEWKWAKIGFNARPPVSSRTQFSRADMHS